MLYVVSYDIPCDKRRRKVAELLEGYGQRVQYSVFECDLSEKQLEALKKRLSRRINQQDSVRIYPISAYARQRIEVWNGVDVFTAPGSFIV
ncbi:MAG: CRISPR-associated endonuclease Cas2 [Pseudanabaenaceae cyanobacterium SKYGB_i_bin29]|nr:CRISPR-associated endonuclease Cas2 [Pseudanabaenaceae cyanobacterium SKYG29]MDW8420444.1 CRISPR-associated endonuclease Cas2 [Pseudanabaenaceae cyanobacterium SKYGB_i_bin29]